MLDIFSNYPIVHIIKKFTADHILHIHPNLIINARNAKSIIKYVSKTSSNEERKKKKIIFYSIYLKIQTISAYK
jgi:hypothetical protein